MPKRRSSRGPGLSCSSARTARARPTCSKRCRCSRLAAASGVRRCRKWCVVEAVAEHGAAIAEARARTIADLDRRLSAAREDDFPRGAVSLEGWVEGELAATLKANRARDAIAGRATEGPHRQDLAAFHRAKRML